MVAFIDKTGKSEGFGCTPIDSSSTVNRFFALNKDLGNLRVEFALRRKSKDLASNVTEHLQINTSIFEGAIPLWVFDSFPLGVHPLLSIESKILALLVSLFKVSLGSIIDFLECLFLDTVLKELLTVDITHWIHFLDNIVHERLGVRRLVKLVMAHLTVPDKVNDNVTAELLTVLGSDAESIGDVVH